MQLYTVRSGAARPGAVRGKCTHTVPWTNLAKLVSPGRPGQRQVARVATEDASKSKLDERLLRALEIQLKQSLEAQVKKGALALTSEEIKEEAKVEAREIVEAYQADPTGESQKVLADLRTRVPLISQEQVAQAIQRQINKGNTVSSDTRKLSRENKNKETAPDDAKQQLRQKVAPSRVFDDGTMLFTAEALTAVKVEDVAAHQRKQK